MKAALVLLSFIGTAWAQDDDVRQGHHLAVMICFKCHMAAADQAFLPEPPEAPSFVSIMRRREVTAETLKAHLTNTHRGIDRPTSMPNPQLMDYQIR